MKLLKKLYKTLFLKILYIFISIAIIILVAGVWGLKPLLSNRIKNAVLESTNGLYRIDFNDIQYSPITGIGKIKGVNWSPDSLLFDELRAQEKLPNNIYKCKADVIILTGLKLWAVVFSKKLNLNIISVNNPFIEILHEKHSYNTFKKAKTPYQFISKFIKSFSVEKINFNNINFTYTNLSQSKKSKSSTLESLDLEVSNFLIDSTSHKDTNRFYYTKECLLKLRKIEIPSDDLLNTFSLDLLEFSTQKRSLSIQKIAFKPRFLPIQYGNYSNGDDRIAVVCESLTFSEIDLEKLFNEKKLYASLLNIDKGNLSVFSDERPFKRPPKVSFRQYPHQAFKMLNLKCYVNLTKLKNFNVTFSQYNPETKLTGHVYFRNLHGKIHNLTNDTIPLQRNPICKAVLSTKFMKNTPVDITFNFNMAATNGAFQCTGNVPNMALTDLNQVTNALVNTTLTSGILDHFSFNLKGNKFNISGPLVFLYHDLKINLLKGNKQTKKIQEQRIISFLVNNTVIKPNNPWKQVPKKDVMIDFKRDPQKGFFSVCWQALLEGIKETTIRENAKKIEQKIKEVKKNNQLKNDKYPFRLPR